MMRRIMVGQREKKRHHRRRLPGSLVLLGMVALLLVIGGPRGVAVNSPASDGEGEIPAELESPTVPGTMPEKRVDETAPAPSTMTETVTMPEREVTPSADVPESEPVEDSYFQTAVFLGDSRTDGFRLYSGLNQGTYLCSTGATVESVFSKAVDTPRGHRPLLDALAGMDCQRIYVMLGVNELGWNGTEMFQNQSRKLIQRLRQDHPEAKIVIQSLLPVTAEKDAEKRYVNNQRIQLYNEVWKGLAEELDVVYLDVSSAFADAGGCLPEELSYDGVHLNREGCRIWLEYLKTHPVQ